MNECITNLVIGVFSPLNIPLLAFIKLYLLLPNLTLSPVPILSISTHIFFLRHFLTFILFFTK